MTTKPYSGPERRTAQHLSEEQIEDIAERAAEKAVEKMTNSVYQSIGQTVVKRILTGIGILTVAAWVWLNKHGVA